MAEMIRVGAEKDLPAEGRVCEMADGALCVARVGGEIAVVDGVCPHAGGPLGQGIVENGRVVCPYHAWAFDLKTGEALHSPAAKVRVFEWAVKDGDFLVRSPEKA